MDQVIGIGAGGHAKVVIEIIRLSERYEIVGLLDKNVDKVGKEFAGITVLGDDSMLPALYERGMRYCFIGVGSLNDRTLRPKLYDQAINCGFEMIAAVHPSASVSSFAKLGFGPAIMAMAVVNPGSIIGNNVIINSAAVVDHDCVIGSHVHVASNACLSGDVIVGDGSFIGAGSVVRQGISIGSNAVVAAGAVVVEDVPDAVTVMGVPARIYREKNS